MRFDAALEMMTPGLERTAVELPALTSLQTILTAYKIKESGFTRRTTRALKSK